MKNRLFFAITAIIFAIFLGGCLSSFSPDGRQLVFLETNGISTINTDGSGYKRLWRGAVHFYPSWTPDGRKVIFAEDNQKSYLSIYDLVTRKIRKIDTGFDPQTGPIAWRPDGKQFAVLGEIKRKGAIEGKDQIRLFDWPSCSLAGQFSPTKLGVYPSTLFWLSNEEDIVFLAGNGENNGNVYRFHLSEVKQITTTNDVAGVGISPEGNKLVWMRRSLGSPSLYSIDLANNATQRLPFTPRLVAGKQRLRIDATSFPETGGR